MVSHAARLIGFVLWGFLDVCWLSANDRHSNGSIKLPISDATDRVFVPITAGEEASHAWVGQIAEDDQGFLWFATSDGLDRYDGYQVRAQSAVASGAADAVLLRNCCFGGSLRPGMARYALLKDRSGKIWIGADESLYKYDPETEHPSRLSFAPGVLPGTIRSINQDRSGMIWLATIRGLARYNPANGETDRFLHNESDLASLTKRATLETKDGTFWVATSAGVDIFDRQTGKVTRHFLLRNPLQKPTSKGNPSVRLLEDHSGTLWIVSARDGLAFVDRQRTKLTFVALARGSDLEPGAWAILEDRYGALWIGTEQGLLHLDRDRTRLVRYRNDPADPGSLPADWVLALFEDHEDGIWVGMANAGVARLSDHTPLFRRYRRRPRSGGPFGPDYVFTAFEDSRGEVWAGTMGAINHIDLKTGRYTAQPVGENTQVGAITEDRSGQFWIGTVGGSLFRFNPATRQSVVYRQGTASSPGCVNNEVRALFVDHLGTLWVGARDSLCSFDPVTNRFRVYTAGVEGVVEINAIAEDAAGILWIGCRYGGVQRFDPVTGKFTIYRHSAAAGSLSNDVVTSILADRSGTIWAGTLDGLNRLDVATGKFTVYRERDGLPGSIINGVVEDANGDLWITTSYGLSHFRRRSGTFYNYYRSDGVLDNLTGAWKGSSGQIFFGSHSGLTVLSPDAVDEKLFIPRVVLTNFQISDKPVPVGADSPLKKSISVTKALTLSHSQNTLSFEFAALNYADPERIRYRYRLARLENEWHEVTSRQHFARYSTLAPDQYVFQVEARTSRGNWTEKGAEVRILILPPWWSTWWFRLAGSLAIACLAWAAYQWRIRQLQRREKELREVIETIPTMAWAALPDGSHAFVNQRWREYTGSSAVDAADAVWKNAVHPEDIARYTEKWKNSVASGELFEDEVRLRRASDGEYRSFLERAVPLRDKHDNILKWFGITIDIEDRKRTEEERERLRLELARINRVTTMGELTASLAHELRQPIAAAATNARTCLRWLKRDQPHIEEACDTAARIVSDVNRANDIISRVRSLFIKSAPERELVDVSDLITEILALLRSEVVRYQVSVRTDFAARVPRVFGDRVQLQQVLMNVMLNGIQAMKDVHGNRELTITRRVEGSQLLVSISDTGVGLPAENTDQIFTPFFTTKPEGTGMGLAIARSIVESHTGRLWATANDGLGATFHLSLPTEALQA